MKQSFLKMVLCLCLVLGSFGVVHADGHTKKMSTDEQAIANFMNNDVAAAWKSNKPGEVMDLFTDTLPVVWMDAGKNNVVTNKEEREKYLKDFFTKNKVLDFSSSDIAITKVTNNMGFVTCTQKMHVVNMETNKQEEITMQAIYEVVKPKDGKWSAYREMVFLADAGN